MAEACPARLVMPAPSPVPRLPLPAAVPVLGWRGSAAVLGSGSAPRWTQLLWLILQDFILQEPPLPTEVPVAPRGQSQLGSPPARLLPHGSGAAQTPRQPGAGALPGAPSSPLRAGLAEAEPGSSAGAAAGAAGQMVGALMNMEQCGADN